MGYTKYYGFSRKNYNECINSIEQANQSSIKFVYIVSIVMISYLLTLSLLFNFLDPYRTIYLVTDFLLIILFPFFKHCLRKDKTKCRFYIFFLMSIIFGLGIALGMPITDEISTAFPVLLVIVPIFFIDNSTRMSFFTAGVCAIYCAISYYIKDSQVAFWDMFDGVSFCIISFVSHYYVNSRIMRGMLSEKKRDAVLESYRKVQMELKSKVQKDPLTQLYNRSAFIELATIHFEKCQQTGCPLVLGILDLDHFKDINDTYGHQTGDRVIIDVADILRSTLRSGDIVGRLGGDEYIFILNDISDKKAISDIIHRVLNSIERVGKRKKLSLHGSAGLVIAASNEMGFDNLYQKADIALYQSKNSGRNRFSFYDGQFTCHEI